MLHIKNLQPVTMKAQREKNYEKQEVGTLKKKRRGWKICLGGGDTEGYFNYLSANKFSETSSIQRQSSEKQ